MKKKITISCDGEIRTHISGGIPTYVTLCGLDGDDPDIQQYTVPTPKSSLIDCEQCSIIWMEAMKWRASDFK